MTRTDRRVEGALKAIVAATLLLAASVAPANPAEAESPATTDNAVIETMIVPAYAVLENTISATKAATDHEAPAAPVEEVAYEEPAVELQPVQEEEEEVVPSPAPTTTTEYAEPATTTQASVSSNWFRKMGVIDEAGWHYTWYSSNAKRHRNTGSWVLGDDSIWRTTDGYVVVACVATKEGVTIAQGDIVPTPFGPGKVCDSGCAAGTIDIYVGF